MAFMDRLKKGTVPPQIKDLWDNLKTREQKTKLINNVMTKSRRGYVFNEESEVVEARLPLLIALRHLCHIEHRVSKFGTQTSNCKLMQGHMRDVH